MVKKLIERINGWPIAKKITSAIVFFIALPMLVLLLAISFETYHAIVRQTIDNTVNSVQTFSSNAQTIFEVGSSVSRYVTANDQVQKSLRLFQQEVDAKTAREFTNYLTYYLDRTREAHGLINSIIVISRDGDVFSSRNVDIERVPVQSSIEMANESASGDWYTQDNLFINNLSTDGRLITRVQKISDVDSGASLGYVLVNIPERLFFERFARMQYGDSSFIGIVNASGEIISSSGQDVHVKESDTLAFLQGEDSYQYHKKLSIKQDIGIKDWVVYAEIPIRDIFFKNTRVVAILLVAGVLFLSLISAIFVAIMHQIARPIRNLADQMVQVGEGDLESSVDVGGLDEIGRLSESFNQMTHKLKKLMENIVADEHKNRELEFMVLQSQIKPHFLYNTLEGICALIVTEHYEDAYDTAKNLGLLYRSMMSKNDNIVTVREELKICRYYLDIQCIRYRDKLQFEFHVDDEVLDAQIVKLALQPLIENAIYHGIKEKEAGGRVVICGTRRENDICISVTDDGVGMDAKRQTDASGQHFGLNSVNERIRLTFGARYGVEVESQLGIGTRISVRLPDGRSHDV